MVVLEVGMGGRFDASNVIASHLSVVTSIGECLAVFIVASSRLLVFVSVN